MSTTEEWTVNSLLQWTTSFFKKKGLESPKLEADLLLADALGCSRLDLILRRDEKPSEEVKTRFRDYVRRRGQGEPVAYLIGTKEFFTYEFEVDGNVLIPRPETEELTMAAIQYARAREDRIGVKGASVSKSELEETRLSEEGDENVQTPARKTAEPTKIWKICDVGTGSGCIAVSIAKQLQNSMLTAIDLSEEALEVAKKNAEKLEVANRIEFVVGNLLEPIPTGLSEEDKFDIIVSNPPYVSKAEYDGLETTVRDFEPKMALVGGETGAELPIRLLEQAPERLRTGGKLFMELSPTTVRLAEARALQDERWTNVEVVKDLARLERFLFAVKK